ncbi:MAG: osmotically-inducible protein OsmY [Vicingaceae bacterium]
MFAFVSNPTNESITVKIANFNKESNYQYQINSVEGKLMLNGTSKNQQLKIEVSELAKGSYIFVLFESGEQVGQTVLIKQ